MKSVKGIFATESVASLLSERRLTVSAMTLVSICVLSFGMLLQVAAYGSIQPIVICLFFIVPVMFLLRLKHLGWSDERRAYLLVYSIGWFWAGIAALYANYLKDPLQITMDAAYFYKYSINDYFSGMNLIHASTRSEGALMYKIWTFFYDLFASIGFEKGRYIGIAVNVTFVALTAVVGVRIMKMVFGRDEVRIRRFTLIFSCCGVFWLFGAIHNRDAAILFAVTLLVYYWIRFLHDQLISNVLRLSIASVVAHLTFVFLRKEFLFIPIVMILTGFTALVIGKVKERKFGVILFVAMLLLIAASYFFSVMWSDFLDTLTGGNEYYSRAAREESGAGSLGYELIINQPLPLRLIAGFIYLFIYPIPFWSGFQLVSAYDLFKSFHVVFMLLITPLFALAVLRVIKSKMLATPPILFLLLSFVGFTLSVAGTSLETRHFGVFLPILLLIAMVPDLSLKRDRLAYRKLLTLFVSAIVLVHLAWAVMKFA